MVQFAQITPIDNGTIVQRVNLKDNYSFCRMEIALKLKPVLQMVQFAQINNGTILERVNLKRLFFILQVVLKLETGL